MAEKASRDRVAADMQPANFRAAVQLIRHDITKKKEKIAATNKEIGDKWAQVEGFKVNRKAGKIFAGLDKMSQEDRIDVMRSLNGMIDAAGWDETAQDLADIAEGNVLSMRVGKSQSDEGDDDADGETDGEEAEPEEEPEKPSARRGRKPKADSGDVAGVKSQADAIRASRSHLRAVPNDEVYTGDNSDLAAEG